jgi:hypothetical protein
MICGGQLTVPQPPLYIKIINFNTKMSFDGTSKDIFALKYTYLMKRGGKGTAESRPLHIGPQNIIENIEQHKNNSRKHNHSTKHQHRQRRTGG